MAPVFTNMGLAFDSNDSYNRSQTPVAGRDRHGLSKAERLLGVSDAAGLPHHGTPEWRPRQRKLRNMGSNLSLLTDLKAVISGSNPRSASRVSHRTPLPPIHAEPRRIRPGLKLQTDQRSVQSETGLQDKSPSSAATVPSYYCKPSPGSPNKASDIPDVPELPAQEIKKPKMGKYTEQEQEKIISNLAMNGMMSSSSARSRDKRPQTAKGHDDRKHAGHSRGGSGASKGSNAASSRYSQDQQGRRYSRDRNGSTSSTAQPAENPTPQRTSNRKSSQVLSPRMDSRAPGIRVSRIDSPEGERIRTWLTYTDTSGETGPSTRHDWLAPGKLGTVQESQSTTSVHTLATMETGSFFPIQGGPDDWSTIKRHSRQSSVLVRAEPVGDGQGRGLGGKGSKVYYTDLAVESVLALSSSDSESDAESEASALARKRLSLVSNGNETQPTAWSSTASSRSQSRKMSMNTHATSPNRFSFSSDQWNHPMPAPQKANLSREPSGASQEPSRLRQPSKTIRQPSPMRHEVDEVDLSDYPQPAEETVFSPTDRGPPSSPTLSPRMEHGPQLARMTLIAQEATPNPLLEAVRQENRARKGSTASQASNHSHSKALSPGLDHSSAPSHPPTKPLPMPPVQSPGSISTPTIQTPSGDDDNSSVFSFPKPPRVLNKARSRSTDLLSSPSESIAPNLTPGQGPSVTSESTDSDGSNDTVKPSIKRRPSNLSTRTAADSESSPQSENPEVTNNLLSPDAAYRGSPVGAEEKFSPLVLTFPDHIHQQMQDDSGIPPDSIAGPQFEGDPSIATGFVEPAALAPEVPTTTTASQSEPQPLVLDIPPRTSSRRTASQTVFPEPGVALSGPRSAPLAIKTDLSPVAERPFSLTSPTTAHTAPPAVTTPPVPTPAAQSQTRNWEKALAANFPAIPLAQAPSRPLRRFHLPTTSTGSTMTSRSSPSPRMRQDDFETKTMPTRAGTPSGMRSVTPMGMRATTPVGWASDRSPSTQGRRHSVTPRNSDGSTNTTRGMRTSKRISTGKGIEPLRLSRIGNAV